MIAAPDACIDPNASKYCETLLVSMNGGALASQGVRKGKYKMSAVVNGKPSWASTFHAIWYRPQIKNWVIGSKKQVGTSWVGIKSNQKKGPWTGQGYAGSSLDPYFISTGYWEYWNGNSWKDNSEITVSCFCQTLLVNLNNEARQYQGSRQGFYDYYGTTNGRPSWVSTYHAIWYISDNVNEWLIGPRSRIGQDWAGIVSTGDQDGNKNPNQVPNNVWKYWANGWQAQKNPDDISFYCLMTNRGM